MKEYTYIVCQIWLSKIMRFANFQYVLRGNYHVACKFMESEILSNKIYDSKNNNVKLWDSIKGEY